MNHTMAPMLAMVVNEKQDDWYLQLPHVELAYNSSVSSTRVWRPTMFTWVDFHVAF